MVKASSDWFRIPAVFLATALLGAVLSVAPLKAQKSSSNNAPASAGGGRLYAKRCSRCHGENGEGTGNAPPLRGKLVEVTDGEVDSILSSVYTRNTLSKR
jgi:mono/diheme cytochrome c family protein